MKHFFSFFGLEWRRLIKWWNLVIWGTLLLVALIFTQIGIGQYKSAMKNKDKFLEFEKKKIEQYINYRVFGTYGFQVMTSPVPMSVFFSSSSPFPDMTALIDTSERLKIFNTLQAGSAFRIKRQTFTDLSGVFLFFGSFLFFIYGFEAFLNKPLTKVLASIAGMKRAFIHIALSRSILVTIYCSAVLVLAYLLAMINGVFIPVEWGLAVFLAMILLCSFFFFALGAFLGYVRPAIVGCGIGIFLWFFMVQVFPAVIDTITSANADSIGSIYEIELKKLEIYSNFEKKEAEKNGILKIGVIPSKEAIEGVNTFLKNDYKKLQSLDAKMIEQMGRNVNLNQWLSILLPTSHYFSINSNLGGGGYDALLKFYRSAMKVKRDFLSKYLDVAFFSGNPNEKVIPFLKENENLFKFKTQVSLNLLWGILVTLLYTFILYGLAYKRHWKSLLTLPKKSDTLIESKDIKIESAKMSEFLVSDDLFDDRMFCYLSGGGRAIKKKGLNLRITFDGKELRGNSEKLNFLYLCGLQLLPHYFDTGDVVSFFIRATGTKNDVKKKIIAETGIEPLLYRRIGKLNGNERTMVILALLKMSDQKIFLLNRMEEGVSFEMSLKLKTLLDEMTSERNAAILFLLSDRITFFNKAQRKPHFGENYVWSSSIEDSKNLIIGDRIRRKRKELHIKQKEMAEALGITSTYLSEIENGKGNPGRDIFIKLASIYDIDFQYLFEGDEDIPVKIKRSPGITDVDISDEIDSVDKLVWLMERSAYVRNSILALGAKFILENEEFIKTVLDEKEKKQ